MIETAHVSRLIEELPYKLTNSQLNAWEEIKSDLISDKQMNRLLQGEVGCGKTMIAILSILLCVSNNKQAAFMAPTEVLALQHYQTIKEMGIKYQLPFVPILLTGSLTAKEKSLHIQKLLL